MNNDTTNKYDDSAKGGYSYEEKLNLVAADAMDPKEIDLVSAEDAKRIIIGQDPPKPKLGDFVVFEASVVPLRLRAHWARKEVKIITPGSSKKAWEADWCEQNKGSHLIQGQLRSGTMLSRVQQDFADPILGFAVLLRQTADMLEAKYAELKKEDPNPIVTRDDIFDKMGDETIRQEDEAEAKSSSKAPIEAEIVPNTADLVDTSAQDAVDRANDEATEVQPNIIALPAQGADQNATDAPQV